MTWKLISKVIEMKRTALNFWVAGVAGDALTDWNMSGCIAQSVDATDFRGTRIFARFRFCFTILTVAAIIVRSTSYYTWLNDTIAEWR